jgi:NAD(P)-dependent dehydrogenase (short-subunit alcohol dehydrogenase family)
VSPAEFGPPSPSAGPTPSPVLVTGGASGLGAAVVRRVWETGGRAGVLDLRQPGLNTDHELVDLSDARAAEAATRAMAERWGGLAALVTAAGIDACGPMAQVPGTEWDRVIKVNLLGTAAVVRAALPHLEASGGRVVTVASTLGFRALPDATAYCASKFGVVGLTRALSAELAGRVGVTLIVPGGMQTGFFDDRPEQYRPGEQAVLNPPERVAEAILFALRQPPGCEVRELVITPDREPSWP